MLKIANNLLYLIASHKAGVLEASHWQATFTTTVYFVHTNLSPIVMEAMITVIITMDDGDYGTLAASFRR